MEDPVVQYSFPPQDGILFWNGYQVLCVEGTEALEIKVVQFNDTASVDIKTRRKWMREGVRYMATLGEFKLSGSIRIKFSTGLRPAKGFLDLHTGALRIVMDGPKRTMVIVRQDLERPLFWLTFFGAIPEGLEVFVPPENMLRISHKISGAYLAVACADAENESLLSQNFDALEQAHTAKWAGTPWE